MNAIQSSNSSSELAASVSGRKNAAMSNALSADSSSVSEASVIPSRTSAAASGAASSHVTSSEVLESVTSSSTGNNETNINHGSESIYELVLDGSCQFDRLPPLGKKIVRIFVSSTFSDTKEERNALMERVYPKLADFCRNNYGLEFQVVDMRWGVPEHASDNHSTSDLCINEIIKCQELSAGPNFVAVIGNRYGYRPVPTVITCDEFVKLKSAAASNDEWSLVDNWYKLDNNSISTVYVLQPVSVMMKESNAKNPQTEWSRIELELARLLRQAARSAHTSGLITDKQLSRYFISVTENEIVHGILDSVADPKSTSLCIVRNIIDIKNHVERHPRAAKFTDVVVSQSPSVTDTGTSALMPDDEADQLLRDLRDNKVMSRLSPDNVWRYEINWKSASFEDDGKLQQNQLDFNAVGATVKKSEQPSSAASRHATYIDALCQQFYDSVTRLITTSCSRLRGPLTDDGRKKVTAEHHSSGIKFCGNDQCGAAANDDNDETHDEVLQHLHFAKSRCELFHGRQDTMTAVRGYLAGRSRRPLIVYGPSGCGKTSILAKTVGSLVTWAEQAAAAAAGRKADQAAAADCNENTGRITGKKKIVTVVRFLGTTPKSSNVRDLLSSVCRQLHAIYNVDLLQKRRLFVGGKKKEEDKTKNDKRNRLVPGLTRWQEPDKMSDLVADFNRLLRCARRDRPLLLVLDSIDQLSPVYDAYRVTWLPIKLPLHVKLIVSTLVEGYDVFNNLRQRYTLPAAVTSLTSTGNNEMADEASFIEVGPLGQAAGLEIVHRWLDLIGRRVTNPQQQIVAEALGGCSYPLYARLIFDQVRRWHSYDPPSLAVLQPTVQGAIGRLYEQMEEKFGRPIVRHSLAYVTGARHGLTETELEHILSLDDRLLNDVFGFWKPPVRRIPPLLWTRLRADLGAYIVERSADGGQRVLGWYHRQFAAAARQRYLTPQPNDEEGDKVETNGTCFAAMIHEISAEFFSGRWGGGKPKPFRYTEQQVKRFALKRADDEADRKVPRQPYRIETTGLRGTWINRRRLSEYPWHLLHAGTTAASATAEHTTKLTLRQRQLTAVESIKRRVFFDYNWLYSKLKSGDSGNGGSGAAQGLIDELEYFMELDSGGLGRDSDMRTLVATLRLIRPYVDRYPESLGVELAGRLAGLVGRRRPAATQLSAVDRLIAGCDRLGVELCPIRPVLTCFESADLGLRSNLAVRSTEPWIEGGAAAVVCNRTMTTVFLIDYDDHGLPTLSTWDLETGDRVSDRVLVSGRQLSDADKETAVDGATTSSIVDIYIDARLVGPNEDHLLALYVPRYYGLQRERSGMEGFADVIRLADGAVVRTLREFLSGQSFHNSLLYLTDNWVAIRYGWGVPLFNLWKDTKVGLTKPHALSNDESKFVLVRSKKVGMKSYHGEEKVVAYSSWNKVTTIHTFGTKQELGNFDKSEAFTGVTLSADSSAVLLTDCYGNIQVYDIGPSVKLGPGKVIRVRKSLSLPAYEKITVFDLAINDKEKQSIRQTLITSQCTPATAGERSAITHHVRGDTAGYVIGCYKGVTQWEAFLWSLSGNGRYINRLCGPRSLDELYPRFNHDGRLIVDIASADCAIHLIRCSTGLPVRVYRIGRPIRGLHVSMTGTDMGVLAGKDFLVLDCKTIDDDDDESSDVAATDTTASVAGSGDSSDKKQLSADAVELLPAEYVAHSTVNRRIVARRNRVTGSLEAVEVSASGLAEDEREVTMARLSSARSGQKTALETWTTPDANTVVQLHMRVQVIDVVREEIVYSPRSTDRIQRVTTATVLQQQQQQQQGVKYSTNRPQVSTSTQAAPVPQSGFIDLPDAASSPTSLSVSGGVQLMDGDRIIGDNNKIRLRVTSLLASRLRIINTPSVLAVGSRDIDTGQFNRRHRIQVYQESVLTLSNSYLITCSARRLGRFVNVYDLASGKLLSTHACSAGNDAVLARLSTDDRRLILADPDLVVRIFSGRDFVEQLASNSPVDALSPRIKCYALRDMMMSPFDPMVLILRFNDSGTVSGATRYIHVNMTTGRRGPALATPSGAPLEDVSRDCRIGVDDRLSLYDMREGTVKVNLSYTDAADGASAQARLSDDSKYVIFIDRQDGSLHVVELNVKTVDNSWSHRQVASCFTHAPSRTRLSLRCGGRVVLICDGSIVLSMLAIKDGGANETDEAIEYSGETQRAASILRICSQRSAALVQTLTLNTILSKERTAETPLSDRRPLSSMRKLLPLADIKTLPSASAGIP